MSESIFLSDLIKRPVKNGAGQTVGRVHDLVVRLDGSDCPPVTGVVVSAAGRKLLAPADLVEHLGKDCACLNTMATDWPAFERRDGEALLNKDIQDKEIIDVPGRRAIHISDLILSEAESAWRLTSADVSAGAFLRRVGLGRLTQRIQRQTVPWDQVQFFACEVQGAQIHLDYEKLSQIHPMDLAQIINELSYPQGREIITSIETELAANVLGGVDPQLQTALIESMSVEDGGRILNQMAPDQAADLLARIPEERAKGLVEAMKPEDGAEVKILLDYPEDAAGSVMTTEYVALPQELTVQQALDRLRSYDWLPEIIYYLYILESEDDGKLTGVVTLRDLLMAKDPKAPLTRIMLSDMVVGHVKEKPGKVARKIAHYNLIALPLVDDEGKLRGIVTSDAAMEIILPADWKNRMPRVLE